MSQQLAYTDCLRTGKAVFDLKYYFVTANRFVAVRELPYFAASVHIVFIGFIDI